MRKEYTNRQIKGVILDKLLRKLCIGDSYIAKESFERWISKKVKKNGKRVKRIIDEMKKEGLLEFHKSGKTISLNRHRVREVDRLRREILDV